MCWFNRGGDERVCSGSHAGSINQQLLDDDIPKKILVV